MVPRNNTMWSGGVEGEGVLVAGSYEQAEGHSMDLGVGFLPNFGASDLFVAKLQFCATGRIADKSDRAHR